MTLGMELLGSGRLVRKLQELGPRIEKKATRRAVREAGRPIVRAAKSKAPRETGLLRVSIGMAVRHYRGFGSASVIGPRTNFKSKKREKLSGSKARRAPHKYAHLVEFGTVRSRARPFLRPAYDAGLRTAKRTIAEVLREELRKAARARK